MLKYSESRQSYRLVTCAAVTAFIIVLFVFLWYHVLHVCLSVARENYYLITMLRQRCDDAIYVSNDLYDCFGILRQNKKVDDRMSLDTERRK